MVQKKTKEETDNNSNYLASLIHWITPNTSQHQDNKAIANPRQQLMFSRQLKRRNRRNSRALPECDDTGNNLHSHKEESPIL